MKTSSQRKEFKYENDCDKQNYTVFLSNKTDKNIFKLSYIKNK